MNPEQTPLIEESHPLVSIEETLAVGTAVSNKFFHFYRSRSFSSLSRSNLDMLSVSLE